MNTLNRRQFLRALAASGVLAALPKAVSTATTAPRVVVVGEDVFTSHRGLKGRRLPLVQGIRRLNVVVAVEQQRGLAGRSQPLGIDQGIAFSLDQARVLKAGRLQFVAHEFGRRNGLINAKMALGTANYIEASAMTAEQCLGAIERGAEMSCNLSANGCNLVGFGEMGIGNTASASLLTHCLTGTPLADCIGRGTGLDDAGLARKQTLLEQALKRYREAGGNNEPLNVLAEFGGFEIAMMVGAMLGAAEAKMTPPRFPSAPFFSPGSFPDSF